jgi:hypothetical protein
MPRKYTRKLKGGDVNIDAVKNTIIQLKDDVIRISNDIEELGKNLELNKQEIVEQPVQPPQVTIEHREPQTQINQQQLQENLQNYSRLMKETGDTYHANTKDAKELLLENIKTNKELLEQEGITEEWLNNIPTTEDVALYDDLKNDIKNKIISIEDYLKSHCFTNGFLNKEPPCANKDTTIDGFEKTLKKNETNEYVDIAKKINSLQALQSNVSNYINNIKKKFNIKNGGNKTKKQQQKSKKNKTRK